jgi:hypothetical protein
VRLVRIQVNHQVMALAACQIMNQVLYKVTDHVKVMVSRQVELRVGDHASVDIWVHIVNQIDGR